MSGNTGPSAELSLSGELRFATVTRALLKLEGLPAGGICRVDLTQVSQADSAAIALLLELNRRAQRLGTRLEFTRAPAQLAALARFYQVGRVPGLQSLDAESAA